MRLQLNPIHAWVILSNSKKFEIWKTRIFFKARIFITQTFLHSQPQWSILTLEHNSHTVPWTALCVWVGVGDVRWPTIGSRRGEGDGDRASRDIPYVLPPCHTMCCTHDICRTPYFSLLMMRLVSVSTPTTVSLRRNRLMSNEVPVVCLYVLRRPDVTLNDVTLHLRYAKLDVMMQFHDWCNVITLRSTSVIFDLWRCRWNSLMSSAILHNLTERYIHLSPMRSRWFWPTDMVFCFLWSVVECVECLRNHRDRVPPPSPASQPSHTVG